MGSSPPRGRIKPTTSHGRRRNIFVLYGSSLLATGVEALLRERGFSVARIDIRQAENSKRLRSFGARDIVIVDTADGAVHPALSIMEVVLRNPKVVTLGLDSYHNRMEVYRKQEKRVSGFDDLVDMLRVEVISSGTKSLKRNRTGVKK